MSKLLPERLGRGRNARIPVMADEGVNRKLLWGVAAAAAVVVAVVLLWPGVEEELAPEPVAAWAAVEAEGSGVARVEAVEIPAGTPFRVHAVLVQGEPQPVARDGRPDAQGDLGQQVLEEAAAFHGVPVRDPRPCLVSGPGRR